VDSVTVELRDDEGSPAAQVSSPHSSATASSERARRATKTTRTQTAVRTRIGSPSEAGPRRCDRACEVLPNSARSAYLGRVPNASPTRIVPTEDLWRNETFRLWTSPKSLIP
jgi:hypothetical protein